MNVSYLETNALIVILNYDILYLKEDGSMEKEYGSIVLYKTQDGNNKIEVKVYENTVWLNQKQLSDLFCISKTSICEHIKNIFEENELIEESTVRKFRTVATNGKTYNMEYYNLDMIMAIGFRVRNNIGINFRKWATDVLKEYMVKGFAINDDILKESGGGRYFKELLSRIRDIRSSERIFWRQVLDIFTTSSDYDPKSKIAINFFKTVQKKCIMLFLGIQQLKLLKKGQTLIRILWGLLILMVIIQYMMMQL